MADKLAPDWERIEFDYRAGLLSLREIASRQGVSHVAIKKRADKEGWTRDLNAKIKAKADALVNKAVVTGEVNSQRLVTEAETIAAGAQRLAEVKTAHHSLIARGRALALKLLEELEGQTGSTELLNELGELLRREDEKGVDKLNDLYRKVISSAGRVTSFKALTDALKNVIGMERETWGMSAQPANTGDDMANLTDADLDARINQHLERIKGVPG